MASTTEWYGWDSGADRLRVVQEYPRTGERPVESTAHCPGRGVTAERSVRAPGSRHRGNRGGESQPLRPRGHRTVRTLSDGNGSPGSPWRAAAAARQERCEMNDEAWLSVPAESAGDVSRRFTGSASRTGQRSGMDESDPAGLKIGCACRFHRGNSCRSTSGQRSTRRLAQA